MLSKTDYNYSVIAPVAQWIECFTSNEKVAGSSPAGSASPHLVPSPFLCRNYPVAIGTEYVTFIYFSLNLGDGIATGNHLSNRFVFSVTVMKFQDNRVTLSAVFTGMSREIL